MSYPELWKSALAAFPVGTAPIPRVLSKALRMEISSSEFSSLAQALCALRETEARPQVQQEPLHVARELSFSWGNWHQLVPAGLTHCSPRLFCSGGTVTEAPDHQGASPCEERSAWWPKLRGSLRNLSVSYSEMLLLCRKPSRPLW